MSHADEIEATTKTEWTGQFSQPCPQCGESIPPQTPHECEKAKADGCEKVGAEAFLHTALGGNRNVSTLTFLSLTELLEAYAKHLLVTIDSQAEQIAKYKASCNKVACMWCSADIPADRSTDEGFLVFLGKMAEHLSECKKHPLARKITELVEERSRIQDAHIEELLESAELRERLEALKKNLHEECAASAQTIRLLQERINDMKGE